MNKRVLRRMLPLVVPLALLAGLSAPVASYVGLLADSAVESIFIPPEDE